MSKTFKTKDEALKFIKKLSFKDLRYNCIELNHRGKLWVVSYE